LSAFSYLTDVEGINIIIGTTWSHTGIPLIELAKKKNVLMISPSLGKAEFNEAGDLFFNTWPHDFILSANLADYVYEKGHMSVALIGSEQLWVKEQTNAFIARFEELGGTVEVLLEPLPDATEVGSDALKIKNSEDKIDAIISTTDGILVGALVAKKINELGVDLPMYSITIGNEDVAAAQGAYEGMEFLTFLSYTDWFKEEYDLKYGLENLDIGAPSAYDAVMMIAQAMEETNSEDPIILAEYLNSIESYDGASLILTTDGTGGFVKDYSVKKVVDGKIIDLE
jgi:branched-chain amino acid transport system substrate-binding protein